MKNQCPSCLLLLFFLAIGIFSACDTKPTEEPEPAPTGLKKQDITFKWKLVAGKVTAPLVIPDIYDTSNPLIAGNPEAMAAICTKNSVLDLKVDNTFSETSSCYTALGAGNNPQGGTYVFAESDFSLTTTYTNVGTFPILVGRKVVVKSIDKTSTPHKMVVTFQTTQSGLAITTEFTYEKQP